MRIAVIGGGLMGCSAAIACAARGARVTIYEQADGLLQRTATAGEAKIHLGYVYANDPSLATARLMVKGALAFAPFFRRHLSESLDFLTSAPFIYAVHRDSLLTPGAVASHLNAVHAELLKEASSDPRAYFEANLCCAPEALSPALRDQTFDRDHIIAAFRTEEVAIDSQTLAAATKARIQADSNIELRLRCTVTEVERGRKGLSVVALRDGDVFTERFDHVVNAAWAGRLAIDRTLGLVPSRSWLFRLKYGVHVPPGAAPAGLVSTTFVLGPFGDVVRYRDDSVYLSWYPVCKTARSRQIAPPAWRGRLDGAPRQRVVTGSLAGMQPLMPVLSQLDSVAIADAEVRGGTIFAWGRTDIDDRGSELHHRSEIGIATHGRYHSVDPGKLTMAPWFAERCAERIFA